MPKDENSKYNNGFPIPFDVIKANREEAIKELSEGNPGLYHLLNACVDLDIETLSSCGDEAPMITFKVTEENKHFFYSLFAYLEEIRSSNMVNYTVSYGSYERMSARLLTVMIDGDLCDSSVIFMMIKNFIKDPIYIDDYHDFEVMDAMIERLRECYTCSYISDSHSFDYDGECAYEYIIYTANKIRNNRFVKSTLNELPLFYKYKDATYRGVLKGKLESVLYHLYDSVHIMTKEHPLLEILLDKKGKVFTKRPY